MHFKYHSIYKNVTLIYITLLIARYACILDSFSLCQCKTVIYVCIYVYLTHTYEKKTKSANFVQCHDGNMCNVTMVILSDKDLSIKSVPFVFINPFFCFLSFQLKQTSMFWCETFVYVYVACDALGSFLGS